MKRFLAVYIGTEDALARWNELDDEQRRARETAGIRAWMDWGTANAAAIVENGSSPRPDEAHVFTGNLRHQEQPGRVHDRSGRLARGGREAVRESPALHDLPRGLGGDLECLRIPGQ